MAECSALWLIKSEFPVTCPDGGLGPAACHREDAPLPPVRPFQEQGKPHPAATHRHARRPLAQERRDARADARTRGRGPPSETDTPRRRGFDASANQRDVEKESLERRLSTCRDLRRRRGGIDVRLCNIRPESSSLCVLQCSGNICYRPKRASMVRPDLLTAPIFRPNGASERFLPLIWSIFRLSIFRCDARH